MMKIKTAVIMSVLALPAFSQPRQEAATPKIHLSCVGYMPIFETTFEDGPNMPFKGNESSSSLVVTIDKSESSVSFNTQLGKLSGPLEISERWYSGKVEINQQLFGKFIQKITYEFDRMTGTGFVNYVTLPTEARGYYLFYGKCTPVKARF